MPLFERSDRFLGLPIAAVGSAFHFDENQGISIFHDEIDFTMGPPEIASHRAKAFLLSIGQSQVFAFSAQCGGGHRGLLIVASCWLLVVWILITSNNY